MDELELPPPKTETNSLTLLFDVNIHNGPNNCIDSALASSKQSKKYSDSKSGMFFLLN